MPIGAEKVGLFAAAGAGVGNYFGDESLGNCQFGASSITQTGDSTAIDTVLTTGSEAGGPGNNSYGFEGNDTDQTDGVPYDNAVYELTVSNGANAITSNSGSTDGSSINADGDMVLAQFTDLTIDASVCLTTNTPCRGLFVYVAGDCVINGALSMQSRGAYANPTASGGSDSNAVDANGIRLGLFTASGTESFTNDGNDFNGCGTAIRTAIADNQEDLDGDGTIFTISRAGGAGGAAGHANSASPASGGAGATGAATISSGGGSGGASGAETTMGAGSAGTCFTGGTGGGSGWGAATGGMAATANGGAGGRCYSNQSGLIVTSGGGNGGGTTDCDGSGCSAVRRAGDGTGGLIWLVVKGDLTIGASGSITAKGNDGWLSAYFSGGVTGGGCIQVLYGGTLTNNGTITAGGGARNSTTYGAAGGNGGANTTQIST